MKGRVGHLRDAAPMPLTCDPYEIIKSALESFSVPWGSSHAGHEVAVLSALVLSSLECGGYPLTCLHRGDVELTVPGDHGPGSAPSVMSSIEPFPDQQQSPDPGMIDAG